jgi:Tfp pilus assembly protein PilO
MTTRAPLIGILVAILLTVAFYFLLWQPRQEELVAIEEETTALEAQATQLQRQIAELEDVQAREVEIRAQLARLEEYIPTGPAQPAVIRQFQAAADAAGVEITSVTFGEPVPAEGAPPTGEPGTGLAEIPVTMLFEGGYFQMVDLFRRLEVEVPRAILISNVAIAEGEAAFPSLATTWAGNLFTIVPVVPPAEVPVEGAEDGAVEGATS